MREQRNQHVKRDPPPHPREQRAEDDERRDRLPREHITTFSPDPEKATGAARRRRTENFFLKKRKAAARLPRLLSRARYWKKTKTFDAVAMAISRLLW